jgi:PIN domain
VASKTLLPEQDELLCELVEEYEQMGDRPQIRVGPQGRSGSRVWMWGERHRELTGKRKWEDFAELRANGDLRQVKKEQTGTYYAISAAGLKRSADLAKKAGAKTTGSPAPKRESGPPPAVLTTAPSRLDVLRRLAAETRGALDAVLAVSAVTERYPEGSRVITPHPWTWEPLAPENQRLIGVGRKALDAWIEGASGAIRASAPERVEDFGDQVEYLSPVVERSSRSPGPTAPDIARTQGRVHVALDRQLALVEELPSAHEPPATVLVTDTNALIFIPAIETWNVGNERIIVTVLPQVIAELDGKKMDPQIGEKAKSLIRLFKEFDRRGDTLVGVPIVGKVMFREVALDSGFEGAPSWLNKRNADDRILAGALDLAQRELTSRVVLVTRDRNMQNKARRIGLAYIDAEEL